MNFIHEKLTTGIIAVTLKIQTEFPEVYKAMSKTPLFHLFNKNEITTNQLGEYLIEIQDHLSTFKSNKNLAAHL
jgi:hypothetical protein